MNRFNSKGMLVIPNPMPTESICKFKEVVVVKECFCPNGHNLISSKAIFNGFNGIVIRVTSKDQEGLVALSPVYGYKSRVALNIDLNEGDVWEVRCPVCSHKLPVYSKCDCGGDMVCMFLDNKKNFQNCIAICNRIGCDQAGIKYGDEILSESMMGSF